MSVTSAGKERFRPRGRDRGLAEGGEKDDWEGGPGELLKRRTHCAPRMPRLVV